MDTVIAPVEPQGEKPNKETNKVDGVVPASAGPSAGKPNAVATSEPQDPKKLTPEEQMALYEKELKETDWGHQPC